MSYNNLAVIGVDAFVFCRPELYPSALRVYAENLLSSLILASPTVKFILFTEDFSLSQGLRVVFPQANVDFALIGNENQSNLDFYFIPDQLTVLPGRPPPLVYAPRTVPVAVLMHNLLPLTGNDIFMNQWDRLPAKSYLYAMEMMMAFPALVMSPSALEAEQSQNYLKILKQQSYAVNDITAVPQNFVPDDSRWKVLKNRLALGERFIMVPFDTVSSNGMRVALEYWKKLKDLDPELQLVMPGLRNFISTHLATPKIMLEEANRIIFDPRLTYPEFLELLARSSCLFVAEVPLCSFGIREAQLLGVPVCMTKETKLPQAALLVSKAEDFMPIISLFAKRQIFGKDLQIPLEAGQQIVDIWHSV